MREPFLSVSLALLAAWAAAAAEAASPVQQSDSLLVRATPAVLPCATSATRAFERAGGGGVSVEPAEGKNAGADVVVGLGAEITRAIESGAALDEGALDIARIPWVLVLSPGAPSGVGSLADAARAGLEVGVLGGPASGHARRALAEAGAERVRVASTAAEARASGAALLPLSLAGAGPHVGVDVPPLVARAALGSGSVRPEAGRAFLAFLDSPEGQRAFSACGER